MFGISLRLPLAASLVALAIVSGVAAATQGTDVRVSNTDLVTSDQFASAVGAPSDVLQQNEPSITVHPTSANLLAVGMNDVRTLGVSDDAWQGLAVSSNGGTSWTESLVPGFPGDTSAAGQASPVFGLEAASDPWLEFDRFNNLFFAFIAFQRTPPGQPSSSVPNALAVAKYSVNPATGAVTYGKTVIVDRGTIGLGEQHDKEALAVDNGTTSPHHGNVYVCWSRFTGAQDHLTVAFSSDHGETWAHARFLGPQADVNNVQGCDLAVAPDGDLFVSYRTFDNNPQNSNPNDSAIFVARSTDGGRTFATPVQVRTFVDYRQNARRTPPIFRTFALTSLEADANGVYLAFQERTAGGADVAVMRSKTDGATWEATVRPHSTGPGHQLMPALATAGGKLSVIWYDSRSEPAFTPAGPVSGTCTPTCRGMAVFYNQASTTAAGPLAFEGELELTDVSFSPNLFGSIKALTPFIGDYVGLAANTTTAYAVWGDNRDINPALNAQEDASTTTDPPALINARSRDANIYFDKITK